jgi:hypothetical protein
MSLLAAFAWLIDSGAAARRRGGANFSCGAVTIGCAGSAADLSTNASRRAVKPAAAKVGRARDAAARALRDY